MNRRDFFKSVSAALAVIAVPSIALSNKVEKYPDFDPSEQYGNYVLVPGDDPMIAAEIVLKDARSVLPKGTRFELIAHSVGNSGTSDPFMEYSSLGWKYTPNKIGQYVA